ncbi:integrator complex subunit 7 [Aricia agestis]|uniref:integrator complex subunit 7 n=1 Tax=Aricia agestis TaxID=91739 RepID=UPI001C2097C3|nr:integrator complex subunit 7 [Aricia agestis]
MIGVRMNTFNDTSGEPEQDANSALTELDKGLRSGKVGEQCEAIVRFPRLFEKYPFPILINSSFLKLADVFRMGNNFLRLWVLRVCQQSEKHLDKILNVDEFLRRVYSVLHSNDPVARALALRTLGAVAGIIPERQNVHHAIRRGLESHDDVEVDAAIYATTRFAAHSNAFAVAMCNKLSDMVECESTGAERRVKLVKALRTVHGGAVRAQGVLKLLRSLLQKFPSSSLVRAAISALTAIAADTVVHVPDQVELLLSLAMNDPRSAVRRSALLGLRRLAEHAALWSSDSIRDLVRAAADADEHVMLCLQVMQILVRCPAVCAAAGGAGGAGDACGALRQFCCDAALSVRLDRAAIAALVLTRIVVHCYEEGLPAVGGDLMLALESLVSATGFPGQTNTIKPLRTALRCLVQLSTAKPDLYAGRTATVVGLALGPAQGAERQKALLEALAALGALGPGHCAPALPHLLTALQEASSACNDPSYDGTLLVLVCTALLQERAGAALTRTAHRGWEARLAAAVVPADGWTRYRVARAALRYGHYRVAAALLRELAAAAPSEAAQRWLWALHRAATADAQLLEEGISGLEAASAGWATFGDGGTSGGGACSNCSGCGACLALAPAWAAARAAGLAALARAAAAARALCTQPPPAIALAHAQAARDPAAKAGACCEALRGAARALAAAAQRYGDIAQTAFYADDSTLRLLHISQHTYAQLSQFLDRITSSQQEKSELITQDFTPANLEEIIALTPSKKIADISSKLFDNPTTTPGISHRHAEAVLAAVRAACCGAAWLRGVWSGSGGPLCRLALTPAPRAGVDHAAALPVAHKLALKLEGVVLPPPAGAKNKKPAREVKGVQITVTATPHPRSNEKSVESCAPVLTAVQTVTPIRDYFCASQLVGVSAAGLYTVAAAAAFVDQRGRVWRTGPRLSLVVKAHEDPTVKGNAQATRSRF